MNQNLIQYARQLRLSGLLSSLELRLEEARTHQLPHEQFLELVFQDEINIRHQRLIAKRTKAAGFRDQKTLEDFDWTFNPSIKRQQIYDLAAGQFIRQCRDGLFIGPPGLGKSHLVQAIGYHLITGTPPMGQGADITSSKPASKSSTVPSSTWSGNFKPINPRRNSIAPWAATSNPTC